AFLLESTEGDDRLARYSFAGCDPLLTVAFKDGKALIKDRDNKQSTEHAVIDPADFLQNIQSQLTSKIKQASNNDAFHKIIGDLPFAGGLVGYMGYNTSHYFDNIPKQNKDPLSVPEAYYGLYDSLIAFDHQYRRVHILSYRGEEFAKK